MPNLSQSICFRVVHPSTGGRIPYLVHMFSVWLRDKGCRRTPPYFSDDRVDPRLQAYDANLLATARFPPPPESFLRGLDLHPAATELMISDCEKALGANLPSDYIAFLKRTNGAEGLVREDSYVILWSVTELAPLNRSYEVQDYAPGLLIFGSNGGGEAYGFDTRRPNWSVVALPFVGMAWELARLRGSSFGEFLECLQESQ